MSPLRQAAGILAQVPDVPHLPAQSGAVGGGYGGHQVFVVGKWRRTTGIGPEGAVVGLAGEPPEGGSTMLLNDPVGGMLTRLRNASRAHPSRAGFPSPH